MDPHSWSRVAAASKHHQSRYGEALDPYLGFEEMDCGGDEDSRPEYPCPFCSEDFDVVGLCCHIDGEHPVEAIIGVCPLCQVRFGTDMVAHIIVEHGSFFKKQRRKSRKGSSGTHSTISLLKKELQEGNLHPLLGGSANAVATSNADPLLSSFINLAVADSSKDAQLKSIDEITTVDRVSDEEVVESMEPSLSDKDQKERARRSEFVQELLLSTVFDDTL